ncbi:MAG: hypothetical protein GXC73_17045 [Chitinophagaceae bacterium]|nr:hypothetical protein [Chitinophagaceae bacterium]
MKRWVIFIVVIISYISCNYNSNECNKKNVSNWIAEAPVAFEDFLLVKEELLSNKQFIDSFSSKDGEFFITKTDYSYSGFTMPKLENWFKNGGYYIDFKKHDTSICFKEWNNGLDYIYGIIQFGPIETSTKYRQYVDTLTLKNNWHAIVRKCCGCGS